MMRLACSSLVSAVALASFVSSGVALRKTRAKRQGSAHLAGVPVYRAEQSHALADQWMVAFGPEATDATLKAFCSQDVPCKTMGHPDEGGIPFVVVKGSEGMLESSIAARQSSVAFVEQDAEAEDFVDATSDQEVMPWGLSAIGVPTARNRGAGVNVYVLDGGIRVTHSDFGGRAIPLYDADVSPPMVCDSSDTTCAGDDRGHGTHVAGSVGGATYGVAPASTLWAMRRGLSLADGYGCIDWLVQNRQTPAVLQMSWGGSSFSEVARAAVDAAVATMITVVVSAGNSRVDACTWTFAGFPNAIAVASSDSSSSRSYFSNYGPCIDIFAPGSDIISAAHTSDDGSAVMSGTSMASPYVAGAAALILHDNPGMSPVQVLQELVSDSAKDHIIDAQSDNYLLWVGMGTPPPTTTPAPTPPPPPCPATTSTGPDSNGDCKCNSGFGCRENGAWGCTYSRPGSKHISYFLQSCTDCSCQAW